MLPSSIRLKLNSIGENLFVELPAGYQRLYSVSERAVPGNLGSVGRVTPNLTTRPLKRTPKSGRSWNGRAPRSALMT